MITFLWIILGFTIISSNGYVVVEDGYPVTYLDGGRSAIGRLEDVGPVHIFEGLPFGTITERFMPAADDGGWSGVIDVSSSERAEVCWGVGFDVPFPENVRPREEQVEQCLTSTIIRPPTCNGTCAVIVWLSPGALRAVEPQGFVYPNQHRGVGFPFSADHPDTIIVMVNYRVDITGFSYHSVFEHKYLTEYGLDEWEPVGFLDQRLAVKWTYDNIAAFGGDPDLITLMGQSAGGWSVLYHVARPLTNQYVKRFYAMSTDGDDPRIYLPKEVKAVQDSTIFSSVGCTYTGDNVTFLACLGNLTIDELSPQLPTFFTTNFFLYGTILDSEGRNTNERLRDSTLLNQDADVMVEHTRNENPTQAVANSFILALSGYIDVYTRILFEVATQEDVTLALSVDTKVNNLTIAQQIVDFTWNDEFTSSQNLNDAIGVSYFYCSVLNAAESLRQGLGQGTGKVRKLRWNFRCEGYDEQGIRVSPFILNGASILGAWCTHATQLSYLFQHLRDETRPTYDHSLYHPYPWDDFDYEASLLYSELINNFVHTGVPTAGDGILEVGEYKTGGDNLNKITYDFDVKRNSNGDLMPLHHHRNLYGDVCEYVSMALGLKHDL